MFPLRLVSGISQITGTGDGDFVDRMNHRYTPIVFVVFAILASTKQYVGEPINCWTPQHFHQAWVEYANQICWVSNTYYLPLDVPNIAHHREKNESYVTYYQWVPIALAAQAMFFYIPRKLWRMAGKKSGIDIDNIVVTATTFENAVSSEVRNKTIQHISRHLDRYFSSQREYRHGCWPHCKQLMSKFLCFVCNRRHGNYLGVFYLFSKILYIINALAQLVALNEFLGDRYHMYGVRALLDMLKGYDWRTTRRFPRVTMCDFQVRVMGPHLHKHTVQCVLSINLFNEMIFFLIWWWLVVVSVFTVINFMEWSLKLVFRVDRVAYIKKHLKFMDRYDSSEHRKLLSIFVYHYLKADGVFLIRLLAKNTNTLMTSELVAQLWDDYRDKHFDYKKGTGTFPPGHKPPFSEQSTGLRKRINDFNNTNPHNLELIEN